MNILILHWKDITNPHAGGGTRYAHRIAQQLSENHHVTVLSFRYPGSKKKTVINENYTIYRTGNKVSYHIKAQLFVLKHRNTFDLVLDSVILAPKLPFVSLLSSFSKLALVHQFFANVIREEFSLLSGALIWFLELLWPRFYNDFTVITVSESIKEKLTQRGLSNIHVVPPGVPQQTNSFTPLTHADDPLLIYIGRLKRYKGIHHAIKAMPQILNTFPNAKFLIAGKGDYKPKLQTLITKKNLTEHVKLLGYVSEAKKAEMLQQAHLFLFPSIAEGWGIAAIEAQAAGVPVIGTDTDGLRDSIQDGKTGILVPYGQPEAIAKQVIELLKTPNTRKQLAKNAYQWAQQFSWERTLNTIQNIVTERGGHEA